MDVTAVTLSDVLRLYFNAIDPRPYAVCAEAVGDMRRVTVRASSNLTFTALKAILDLHGYTVRQKSGIILICGKQSVSGRGNVDIMPTSDGSHVYTARPQTAQATPSADTWGPPEQAGPLNPPQFTQAAPAPAPTPVSEPVVPTTPRIYKPLWRTPGELLPLIAQTGLGRVLNVTGGGGAPKEFVGGGSDANAGGIAGGSASNFLQTTAEYVLWQGTDDEWGKLCPLVETLDVRTPSIDADVYVLSVATNKSDSDGISLVGRAAGLNFDAGSSRSNSIGLDLGAASLVLSSVRTNENIRLVQHYSASLVNARQQLLNSGASVPIATDVVDLEGGKTRQSTEYRTVGTNVTITPRILQRSVQLDLSIELSSISTLRPSANTNPTFNTERVNTTVDARPGSVSFVSALSSSSTSRSREKFFFIPIGRTDEVRKADIVYMIVLHDLQAPDDAGRKSVCPVAEKEGTKISRPRHCTDGKSSAVRSAKPDEACTKS